MKVRSRVGIFAFLTVILMSCTAEGEQEEEVILSEGEPIPGLEIDEENEWKNGFLISWRGQAEENIRSAHALGYRYVNETCENNTGIEHYGKRPQSEGMRFYLDNPEFSWVPKMNPIDNATLSDLKSQDFKVLFEDYPRMSNRIKDEWLLDLKEYNHEVYLDLKTKYEKYYVIIDGTKTFPDNLALSWEFSGGDARLMPDWQQQAVIDSVVAQVISLAHEREYPAKDYLFAGITMDVPSKWAEFSRPPAYDSLTYDDFKMDCGLSGYALPGVTHDYDTFTEGWMRFMLSLREGLEEEFSDRKIRFLLEPYQVWKDGYCGRWGFWIDTLHEVPFLTMEEKKKIAGDLIMLEGNFVNQFYDKAIVDKVLNSGLLTLDQMAISSPNLKEDYFEAGNEETHLNYVGNLAMKKGWFVSYGRFNSKLTSISERLPQLTLSRLLVNWQNLAMVPLEDRSWNQSEYVFDSPIGHADPDIIYGKEPRSAKYFVVWVNREGIMTLQENERVISARAANRYYEGNGQGTANAMNTLDIDDGVIKLGASGKLDQCYIITVSTDSAE